MKTRSKAPLLLIEIIIMLLIFAICAAVCLNIFAASRRISVYSSALDHAYSAAQSSAECYKAYPGDVQQTAQTLSASQTSDGYYIFYDSNWIQTGQRDDKGYTLQLVKANDLACISVEDSDGTIIFDITTKAVE